MSKAFSNEKKVSSIDFDSKSQLSNASGWEVIKGNVQLGNTIVMEADSRIRLNLSFASSKPKCTYIRLKVRLDADNKSLTTDTFHAVSAIYKITYTDDNGNEDIIYNFTPKYIFEDSFKDEDISDIETPSKTINNIQVDIVNKEEESIKIVETGLYMCRVVDKTYISETATEAIQDSLENNTMDLVIPLIDDISEMNGKPDGAIARCSWIEGVEY